MRSVWLALACTACWGSAAAPPAPPPPPVARASRVELTGPAVTGVVRDAQTGAPLADVVVEIFAPERKLAATTTDLAGTYRFEHIPEGDHQIVFRHATAGSTQQPLMVRERALQVDAQLK